MPHHHIATEALKVQAPNLLRGRAVRLSISLLPSHLKVQIPDLQWVN